VHLYYEGIEILQGSGGHGQRRRQWRKLAHIHRQTVGRFTASPFPGAEVITHDAGERELFGVVLKLHFSFLSGDPWGSGQLSGAAALWARIMSHSRLQPLRVAKQRGATPWG